MEAFGDRGRAGIEALREPMGAEARGTGSGDVALERLPGCEAIACAV